MAEQVEVQIVTVDAVTNLNKLRETISEAKKKLNTLTIGGDDYRAQLIEINKAQNLLTNALNGTTAKEEDYTKALQGTSKTYNTLVKQMADMKKQLRNIDVSTEEGAASFKELAAKINDVNDELKEMDAMKGDFQRNVGNYKSAFEGMAEPLKSIVADLPSGLNGLKGPMDDVTKSLGLMGKQPILGIIGLLAPLITQITSSLGENKAIQDAIKKVMDSMKPVMDFFAGILETVGGFLADIIEKAAGFLGSSGIFNKVIKGVMGVGNAILKYVTAPFKGVIEAIKIFKEQGIAGFKDAAKAFGHEMKEGFSFKKNFEAGQEFAETVIKGAKSKKKDTKKAGKDTAKDLLEGLQEGLADIGDELQKEFDDIVSKMEKSIEEANKMAQKREADSLKGLEKGTKHRLELNEILTADEKEKAAQQYAIQKDSNERRLSLLQQFAHDALARDDWDAYIAYDQQVADLQVEIETNRLREEKRLRDQDVKDAQEAAKKKAATMTAYAGAASGMMSTLADIFEQQGEEDEKSAKMAKNLRIAAATIDMIQGAVTAYSTAQSLGPIAGPVVGAVNAAAVVASGLANIAKIRSTNVSKDSAPTASAPETPATVSAPALETAVPTTTVVNGASTDAALNRASQPQKVYILQSDIEAAGNAAQVQVAESSF